MKTEADNRRSMHMAALRSALWRLGRATRAELAKETGLSAMTIGKLLAVMEARGEVTQEEMEKPAVGRPSLIAQYHADYAHFASIVVEQLEGRSAFSMRVSNLFGETVFKEQRILEAVEADSFDSFFERVKAAGFRLALAVFVLPGVARGDELVSCDLQALVDGQVLRRIKERFEIDVLFENDVNCAVFGHAFDQDRGVCAGIYYPGNYCPGAGVVIDGEILYGKQHFAGEIGWIDAAEKRQDAAEMRESIAQMLVIYACTVAPEKMVLYGDFFSPELQREIADRFTQRMKGCFSMELSFRNVMTPDMENGAKKLGIRRMFKLLAKND